MLPPLICRYNTICRLSVFETCPFSRGVPLVQCSAYTASSRGPEILDGMGQRRDCVGQGGTSIACHKTRGQWECVLDLGTPLAPPIWHGRSGSGTLAQPGQPGLGSWPQWAQRALTGQNHRLAKNRTMIPSPEHQKTCCWESTPDPVESRKSKLETGSQRFVLDCQCRYLLPVGNSLHSCLQ